MEPLKPVEKLEILQTVPTANESEIDEYEQLLSNRFTTDPDLPPAGQTESPQGDQPNPSRLRDLYKKLTRRLKPGS